MTVLDNSIVKVPSVADADVDRGSVRVIVRLTRGGRIRVTESTPVSVGVKERASVNVSVGVGRRDCVVEPRSDDLDVAVVNDAVRGAVDEREIVDVTSRVSD